MSSHFLWLFYFYDFPTLWTKGGLNLFWFSLCVLDIGLIFLDVVDTYVMNIHDFFDKSKIEIFKSISWEHLSDGIIWYSPMDGVVRESSSKGMAVPWWINCTVPFSFYFTCFLSCLGVRISRETNEASFSFQSICEYIVFFLFFLFLWEKRVRVFLLRKDIMSNFID
jgi:hypothetical protein